MKSNVGTRTRAWRAAAVGAALLVTTGTLASCQVVKLGAKCRTNELQHDGGAWIMKCEGGRWRRALTKADAARILLSLQTTTTTAAPVPATTTEPVATVPPTTAAVVPTTTSTTTTTTAPRTDDLDPSFGNDGKATPTIAVPGGSVSQLVDVRATPVGTYVIMQASILSAPGPMSMVVARLGSTGALDPAFSGDGILPLPGATSATVDALGRVVWVLGAVSGTSILRTTTTGAPDTSLEGTGSWTPAIAGGCNIGFQLAPLDDGSVVAAHSTATCGLLRVASDGTTGIWGDLSTFGNSSIGGLVPGPGNTLYVRSGSTISFPTASDRIARLTSTGALDPTFGSGGVILTSSFTGVSYPTRMTVLADGSMIFLQGLGFSFDSAAASSVRRLRTDGQMDTSGAYASGSLTVSGHLATPLPSGGFAMTWWSSATSAGHRAFTSAGTAGTAFGGGDRLRFDGGAFSPSQNVVQSNRFVSVVDRGVGHLDVFRFLPPVA